MAKSTALVRMPAPRGYGSAPIIRVTAPRAIAKPKKHHRRGKGGGSLKSKAMAIAAAGFALGTIDKMGTAIPTIPLLGKAGTIAAALYFFAPPTGFLADAMVAAVAIASYELGSKGSISGDNVASQIAVRGVASQV